MWPAIVVAWGLQWLVFRFKLECWYCHFSSLGIEVRHIVSSQSWGLINNFTCSSGVKDTVCYFLGGLANLLRFQVSWKLCQTNDLCLYLHPQSSPHLALSQTPRTLKDTAKKTQTRWSVRSQPAPWFYDFTIHFNRCHGWYQTYRGGQNAYPCGTCGMKSTCDNVLAVYMERFQSWFSTLGWPLTIYLHQWFPA